MRNLVRAGSSAALLLAMMFVASLVLWVGLPLGCLYIGSRVQGATQSLGLALLAMAGGLIFGIVTLVPLLGWMNRKHSELREARGREAYGQVTLEGVMVVSAALALLGFGVWFFFFSGSAPIPVLSGT
jgi:hypothetical protein